MHPQNHSSKRRLTSLIFFVGLLAALGLGWAFRQNISDWYRLRQYQPAADVVTLADQTTMNDKARRVFYTTHPAVTSKDEFNSHCRQGEASEYSIVLGCYISTGGLYGNMYLYDIDDQRLNGVEQVTAAHEMLHAAYDRLSSSEKQRVNHLLRATYEQLPEGRIKDTVAQYEANNPQSVPNELHSILGTELRQLPKELEDYYRRYFTNRLAIVGFSEQYEAEFTRRDDQVAAYDARLAQMKASIEAHEREIDSRSDRLQAQREQLNRYEAQGNAGAYNSLVDDYNQGVSNYNALVQQTRAEIDEYNNLVATRNNLALEVRQLTEAIDSRPQTL